MCFLRILGHFYYCLNGAHKSWVFLPWGNHFSRGFLLLCSKTLQAAAEGECVDILPSAIRLSYSLRSGWSVAVPSGLESCSFLLFAGWYRERATVKKARASSRITRHQWEMPVTPLGASHKWQACRSLFQKTRYLYNLHSASCRIQFSVILFFFLPFPPQ